MKWILMFLAMVVASSALLACTPVVKLNNPLEITTIEFERVVWALPVGVEILYPPEVPNSSLVLILENFPREIRKVWPVTTAKLYTFEQEYLAVPIRDSSSLEGIRWYIVLDELVPLERMNISLVRIQVFPVLPDPDP